MGNKKGYERKDQDVPGPGTYMNKAYPTAPFFTMGSRFNSDIRSKDHLRPKKVDGPGPGSYQLPSSIKVGEMRKTSMGSSARDWSDLPKGLPAPNSYYPNKFTEGSL